MTESSQSHVVRTAQIMLLYCGVRMVFQPLTPALNLKTQKAHLMVRKDLKKQPHIGGCYGIHVSIFA